MAVRKPVPAALPAMPSHNMQHCLTHNAPSLAHTHPAPARTHTLTTHTHSPRQAQANTHTSPLTHVRPPLPPKKPTYPQVIFHSKALVFLCSPSSARLPLFCCRKRPHMSANTSRQKPASAEQRQPGLPSSQHKAASSYFQACSLSPL